MSKMATISTTVSTTTGLWAWIGNNSGALSVIIGFASLCIALIFYCLNYANNKKTVRDDVERDLVNKIKLAASRGALLSDIIDDGDKIKSFERRRFRHIDRKTG